MTCSVLLRLALAFAHVQADFQRLVRTRRSGPVSATPMAGPARAGRFTLLPAVSQTKWHGVANQVAAYSRSCAPCSIGGKVGERPRPVTSDPSDTVAPDGLNLPTAAGLHK